ncbi:PREDICTED: DNA-directed RNA polymerase I subunit RPA2-like [Acropora digitifera]|uniref:DNA-directed RNA polymerase I subunit RPA2-like n=1 Tax=Acropora digitifera TaxID=70779 RepID=UPI00077A84DF|nr:PREDICTED: DNA-directed RNA polymerase I subunit RPA2-like [Acropora digitifera]
MHVVTFKMAAEVDHTNVLPSLKNLTSAGFGVLSSEQKKALQDLIKPHVESFNFMLEEGLLLAVQGIHPQEFLLANGNRVTMYFTDATIGVPVLSEKNLHAMQYKVYPSECRESGTTYKAKLQVTLQWKINNQTQGNVTKAIANIPLMVKSANCSLAKLSPAELVQHHEEAEEAGGYFIINGIEKVVRMLILPRRNFPLAIARPSWKSRGPLYTEYGIQIRCVRKDQTAVNMTLHYLSDGNIMTSINYRKEIFFVPLIFILKALVNITDQQIYCDLVAGEENNPFLKDCVASMLRTAQSEGASTQQALFKYIGERFKFKMLLPDWYSDEAVAKHLIQQCICIHLDSYRDKFNLLVFMARKLFAFAQDKCAEESADNPMLQEVLLPGHLYNMCLKEKLESWLYHVRANLEKSIKSKSNFEVNSCKTSFLNSNVLNLILKVYMNIALTKDEVNEGETTHLELKQSSMLSAIASLTPFSDFNQSPRNMYQCQMAKQTIGTPAQALKYRCDNKLYRLQTPQSPVVRPASFDELSLDNYALGTNAVVAVISYTGYDMEDAMILNKASFERGFAHGTVLKCEIVDLNQIAGNDGKGSSLRFGCLPNDERVQGYLDADGLPPVGAKLEFGNPFYCYVNDNNGETVIKEYKSQENAIVDDVKIIGKQDGTGSLQKVAIKLRIQRNPIIGDKFSSRHGQKGICSQKWPIEDLPFTESGMTPDIIFNPHGFPSRMTIGMMIETMAGKSACLNGVVYDATPFTYSEDDPAVNYFGNLLKQSGYNYYGTERMYSGTDGREFEADIFFGVVYYQRLRHMVADKFQVRSTGPIDILTHQPVQGRKRQGGIRFGEMERDALLAHGTSFLLQDRLMNCSDGTVGQVCTKCGSILSSLLDKPAAEVAAAAAHKERKWTCKTCDSGENIQLLAFPYVFRYLVAELAGMNIKVSLDVKKVGSG